MTGFWVIFALRIHSNPARQPKAVRSCVAASSDKPHKRAFLAVVCEQKVARPRVWVLLHPCIWQVTFVVVVVIPTPCRNNSNHGAAVAGEPGVEIRCIARTVAFNCSICCSNVDGWCCRVFDRECGCRAAAQAASIRGREGHRDGTRGSAEVAHNGPRAIVVAEGGAATIVAAGAAAVIA